MAQAMSDSDKTIEMARMAAATLKQLGDECQTAGLDILAHFIGVAHLEAEEIVQQSRSDDTPKIIEAETSAWADSEMPDHNLKAVLDRS